MSPRALCSLLIVLGACDVFDASLYQDLEDAGHHHLETIELADRCTGELPLVESGHVTRALSTVGLNDNFNEEIAACTGSAEPGNDGFFRVEAEEGDKWHFHLRLTDAGANPALYVLRSCDERACTSQSGLDECGAGRDEHLSFRAPSTGSFIVGVDSRSPGGAEYEIEAVRPQCGNGGQPEHSETCDDGNLESGDGCTDDCRAEVSVAEPDELEPNDESTNANVVVTDPETGAVIVRGQLGGRCDFDMWAIEVPASGSVRATVLDANGDPCGAASVGFRVAMFHTDGHTVAGEGEPRGDNTCPSFDETDAFADDLEAGRHFVRVTTAEDEATAVGYRLSLEILAP